MKLSIAIVALMAASAALAGDIPPPPSASLPSYDEPSRPWTDDEDATARKSCRDRIEQVRAASGKPELDQVPAATSEPLLHYAVDRRIDDCSVLVPVADPADIRAVQPPGEPKLQPANPDRHRL